MGGNVLIRFIDGEKVLGTTEGESVWSGAADVERGVTCFYALRDVMDTADTVFLFADAAACTVEGEDEGRFCACVGIRIGEREDAFALIEYFFIGDFVGDRPADVSEVIKFYGKKDIF